METKIQEVSIFNNIYRNIILETNKGPLDCIRGQAKPKSIFGSKVFGVDLGVKDLRSYYYGLCPDYIISFLRVLTIKYITATNYKARDNTNKKSQFTMEFGPA